MRALHTIVPFGDGTEKINETFFVAMLIFVEFGVTTGDTLGEAKEALSNQYYLYVCGGYCDTLAEQLKWADSMEGWWHRDPLPGYLSHLANARDVRGHGAAYIYPGNDQVGLSYWWGNIQSDSPMAKYVEDPTNHPAYWWPMGQPYVLRSGDFVIVSLDQNNACGSQAVRQQNGGLNCLGF